MDMHLPRLSRLQSARFTEMLETYAGMVYGVCRRVLRDAQAAEDATQETFIHLLQFLPKLRSTEPEAIAAWLHRAAYGKAVDLARRRKPVAELDAVAEGAMPNRGTDADVRAEVDAALNELAEDQRRLLVRHVVEGIGQERLATELGVSQPTVSRRIATAIDALRRGLVRRGVVGAVLLPLPFALYPSVPPPSLLASLRTIDLAARAAIRPWWRGWRVKAAGVAAALGVAAVTVTVMVLAYVTRSGIETFTADCAHVIADANVELARHGRPAVPLIDVAAEPPRYPTIEALIALLPPVDSASQQRYAQWATTAFSKPGKFPESLSHALAHGTPLLPDAELTQALAQRADDLASLHVLLRDPQLVIGLGGYLAAESPPEHRAYGDRLGLEVRYRQVRSLTVIRESANTLASRVLIAADDEARVDLDRLAAAATRANVDEIECFAGIAVEWIRDRVYLAGARDERIPEATVRRWMREAPTQLGRCSDALRARSWFWTIPLGQDFAAGRMTVTQARGTHGWLSAVNVFERAGCATVAGDSAVMANAAIELAASVRGDCPWCPDPFVASLDGWRHPLSRISLSNLGTMGFTIAEARNRHLAVRLAGELILDARAGHPLPDDLTARIAAAAPEAAGGGALGFGLRYYRLSATRFRIGIDAEGSGPVHADMKLLRAEQWDNNSDLSTTHATVFEIDVDPRAATPFTAPADEPVDRPLGAG